MRDRLSRLLSLEICAHPHPWLQSAVSSGLGVMGVGSQDGSVERFLFMVQPLLQSGDVFLCCFPRYRNWVKDASYQEFPISCSAGISVFEARSSAAARLEAAVPEPLLC